MPYDQPQHMPKDLEELDFFVARAYSQGIDTGRKVGRKDAIDGFKQILNRAFYRAKGRNRRADLDDPKIKTINEILGKLNEKIEDGSLWQ